MLDNKNIFSVITYSFSIKFILTITLNNFKIIIYYYYLQYDGHPATTNINIIINKILLRFKTGNIPASCTLFINLINIYLIQY